MHFVVLTDTHLVAAGKRLYGLDPAARLAQAVEVINRDHAHIEFVIVTGDLAHSGERAAYELLRDTLARLHAPVVLLMGNHDQRETFRAVFPDADDDGNGFVQTMRPFAAATVITLDTLSADPASHAGILCRKRLAFLEHALRTAPPGKPVLLFQHHPPMTIGMPSMDSIKLRQSEELWDVFARTRRPDFMFFGHVHRPVAGTWRGVPFHSQRAVNHQVGFDLAAADFIPGSHEPPDYSFVTVSGTDIVVLPRSFLYDGPAFSLDDPAAQRAQSPADVSR